MSTPQETTPETTAETPTTSVCQLPVDLAYKILENLDTTLEVYTAIASSLIPTTAPDSLENARLLVTSIEQRARSRFSLLISLGVPIVSVTRRTLMSSPHNGALKTVLSPLNNVTPAFALQILDAILCVTGDALDILRSEIHSNPMRLNMFQYLTDISKLSALYIHVQYLPDAVTDDTILNRCVRNGLSSTDSKQMIRIRDIIDREDAHLKLKQALAALEETKAELLKTKTSMSEGGEALSDAQNEINDLQESLQIVKANHRCAIDNLVATKNTLLETHTELEDLRVVVRNLTADLEGYKTRHTRALALIDTHDSYKK